MDFARIKKYILGTSWCKTLRFNLHYFPLKQAVRLPVLVSRHTLFEVLGGGVKIDAPLTMGMLLLGYRNLGIVDTRNERTIWQVSGTVILRGSKIDLGRGSKICVSGTCSFGDHFSITGRSTLICHSTMTFGVNVLLSWDILMMDTDYHRIYDSTTGAVINNDRDITVGDNVWIGCRSTILKGSTIPNNSIIASNSLITGKMEMDGCIYASGQKKLRENIKWER